MTRLRFNKYLFNFLIFFFIISSLFQFADNIKFRHISTEDGLSNNSIYSFFQDSKGFIWIGTEDGLNKYNGYEFEVFNHSPMKKYSVNGGWITKLFEDKTGIIWIGTYGGGLGRFDRTTRKTYKYYSDPNDKNTICSNYMNDICSIENEGIWIGTIRGLNRYIPEKDSFIRIQHKNSDSTGLSNNFITALKPYNNYLWIGTFDGLNRYDIKKKTFKHYKKNLNKNSISSNKVLRIYLDSENIFWIGTKDGLNRFDPVTEKFTRYYIEENLGVERGNEIMTLYGDGKQIWFSSFVRGLYSLNKSNGHISHYLNDKSDSQSLISDKILNIFKDNSGTIWIGTWGKGISYFHPDNQFKHYFNIKNNTNTIDENEVFSICEDDKNYIWLGLYGGGLNRLDIKKNKVLHYKNDPLNKNSLSSNIIFSLAHDQKDNLWIGHRGTGLSRFNTTTNTFTNYYFRRGDKNSISSDFVKSILIDKNNIVWIGTNRGLNKFDPETGIFRKYFKDPDDKNSIIYNNINHIVEDKNNYLWIATYVGLSKMDRGKNIFTNFIPKDKTKSLFILTLYNDINDYLWFGTKYRGLVRFNKKNNKTKFYSVKDGLPSNAVVGILKDNKNNLWISTKNGLAKFNINKENFHIYNKNDGIQSNNFINNVSIKSKNGKFYFGGYNGLTSFVPEKIRENNFSPPLAMTSITIYPKEEKILKNLSELKELFLGYKDTIIIFKFSSLDYRNSKKNKYAYKIEPLQNEWIELGNKHEVTITNLNPGDYTLKIKGSNSDGIWNKKEIKLDIFISPPFWQTWWFRGFLFIIAFLMILLWHKNRLKKQEVKLRSEAYIEQFCIKHKITEREVEIIKLVLDGKTNKEMEDILFITAGTVKNHIYNIFKKLDVKNRTQLAGLLSDWKKVNKPETSE